MMTNRLFAVRAILPALFFMASSIRPAFAGSLLVLHTFTGGLGGSDPDQRLTAVGSTLFGSAGRGFAINTDGSGFFTFAAGTSSRYAYDGAKLYGTTPGIPSGPYGTVFSVSTDGTSQQTAYTFFDSNNGSWPRGALVLDATTLYGTTSGAVPPGGNDPPFHPGTAYRVNTDGTGFQLLHAFNGADGNGIFAGMVLSGSKLYGTAGFGGSGNEGTLFSMNTDGSGFTLLRQFSGSDGAFPQAALVAGSTLYGTAANGGPGGHGIVFSIHTDGTNFQTLHSFASLDGRSPVDLTLNGGRLWGTTGAGGASDKGVIFSMNPDGSDFQVEHNFAGGALGANPLALTAIGDVFYGVTLNGGSSNRGIVFAFVPEPGTFVLAAFGAAGLLAAAGRLRRKKR